MFGSKVEETEADYIPIAFKNIRLTMSYFVVMVAISLIVLIIEIIFDSELISKAPSQKVSRAVRQKIICAWHKVFESRSGLANRRKRKSRIHSIELSDLSDRRVSSFDLERVELSLRLHSA